MVVFNPFKINRIVLRYIHNSKFFVYLYCQAIENILFTFGILDEFIKKDENS